MHTQGRADQAGGNDGGEGRGFPQSGIEAGALVQVAVDHADGQFTQGGCGVKQRIEAGAAVGD